VSPDNDFFDLVLLPVSIKSTKTQVNKKKTNYKSRVFFRVSHHADFTFITLEGAYLEDFRL